MRHAHKHNHLLLNISHLDVDTIEGRALFCDLNLSMSYEQVALTGRNGVGKSTLIETIYGLRQPSRGHINIVGESMLVPQMLTDDKNPAEYLAELFYQLNLFKLDINRHLNDIGLPPYKELVAAQGFSRGELRKLHLLNVHFRQPALLLLDEPSEDLDAKGMDWLCRWLGQWQNGLIMISHDQAILRRFSHFFMVSESGCRYFNGSFEQLEATVEAENHNRQKKYLQQLNQLTEQEKHFRQTSCRRQQKKNQGRWRELGRASPRSVLNAKRSSAQQSQARLAGVRQDKIASVRCLVKSSRRILDVVLPMDVVLPELPKADGRLNVDLQGVSKDGLFDELTLQFKRHRIALVGPNGSGKSTLLGIVMQNIEADSGSVAIRREKVGYIAQGGSNWMLPHSLVEHMLHLSDEMTPQTVMELLIAFKFPLALAERALSSLTPGERTRAALLCLMVRQPCVEFLVLDEPGNSLDFVAIKALQDCLKAWTGGFIIAGHDAHFFEQVGVDCTIALDGEGKGRSIK